MLQRIALCALAFALMISGSAQAWPVHGVAAAPPGVPTVLPGGSQPTVNAGSAAGITLTATYNTITPVSHGSSGDNGYSLRGLLRWNDIPFVEVGSSGVATSRHIGLFAYHPSTDVEKVAGLVSNISTVDVRCDGGSWFTITAPSANPDAGGLTDWNFIARNQDFADGVHQCDAVAHPATGPDIIAQGPGLDQYGNLYETIKVLAVTIDNTAAGSGNILTVPASPTIYNFNNTSLSFTAISIGQSVSMYGVAPNTFIDGDSTTNASSCVAQTGSNCTGAGRAGTYHVSRSQLVASNPAILGTQRSFYFVTNYNGTLVRPKKFVSLAGSDVTSCGTSASPCLTIAYAQGRINAADPASFHKGKFGGTVCLMNGSTYAYSGTSNQPDASVGWTVVQGADQAPCSLGGDPGNPTLTIATGINDRAYFNNGHYMWRYMSLAGQNAPTNASGGSANMLAADHVTSKNATLGTGGLLSTGGAYCVESTSWFGTDGACSAAIMVRNTTMKYLSTDCQHDVAMSVGNTCDFGGPQLFWATGTSTIGSNVITGVTLSPSELAGYTAAQIWVPNATPNSGTVPPQIGLFAANTNETSCFPTGATLYVIAATSNTLSVGDFTGAAVNATSACTSGNIAWPGAHGDNYQTAITTPMSDIIVANNNYAATAAGMQQGEFLETPQISGAYIGHNNFVVNTLSPESAMNNKGGNENYMSELNTYTGGGSMRQDLQQATNGETYNGDQCFSTGGTILPGITAGTNIRAKAAASSSCYTTTTP